MKSTKKSLLTSGFSLAVSAALLVGTTFAWFTDSVTNKGNKIEAGDLGISLRQRALELTDANGAYKEVDESTPLFKDIVWEPGRSYGYDFKISNTGSLALNWEFTFENVTCKTAEIADVIDVYVLDDTNATSLDGASPVGTLAALENGTVTGGQFAAGDKGESFSVVLKMRETAENEYQNASVDFDVKVKATQATVEKDGFGSDQYDKDAEFYDTYVSNTADLKDAIANAKAGDVIALAPDMNVTETITVNKPVTIDGNGAKFNATSGQTISVTSNDVTIKDCSIGRTGKGHAIWVNDNAKNVVIENNTISGPIQATNVENVTIQNNTFNLGYDVAAVTISGNTKDLTFANNTVNGFARSYCVRFYGDGAGLSNIVLENNTLNSGVTNVDMSKATFDLDTFIANGTITIK